ncbi:hypothetical protein OUZ56_016569 [Daphnia magna]|uniref:Uncharacterized protein n=1 Tax=Daphnia magna TaxID=35525 RepID=A0ABR0AQY1_9CRUS|nr:hypothetical protein OUZ56_016569 [Daphnia magna]
MYSTSDPDICRTSDGLPCVMWDILDMPDRCFVPNCNAGFLGFKSDTKVAFFKPSKDCDLLTKWKQSIPREDTDIKMS